MTLMTQADGRSEITERIFENRFMHVEEFRRMNGDVKIEGRSVIINGPVDLQGAEVASTDLRAGAGEAEERLEGRGAGPALAESTVDPHPSFRSTEPW